MLLFIYMKELKDYAAEINKCSKCGLCQAVCPVYKITGNDCAVSRGKFVMLDGVLKKDLTLNKNISKYLDMCLKCGKCKDFCPSGIDACEIFQIAKHDYLKISNEGKFISVLQSPLIFDNIIKIFEKFNRVNRFSNPAKSEKKLILFKGCANKIFPGGDFAIKKILSGKNIQLIETDFKCCGLPFKSSGNLERYSDVKSINTKLINTLDCDYIITDCASCENELNSYQTLNKPVISTGEFLAGQNINFEFDQKIKVTFHKPCHLTNSLWVEKLFAKCKNLKYIEMKDYDSCCGFAGQFAITNRKLSKKISKLKAQNILETGADIVVTACPACILGLNQGIHQLSNRFQKPVKVMNIIEMLSNAKIV